MCLQSLALSRLQLLCTSPCDPACHHPGPSLNESISRAFKHSSNGLRLFRRGLFSVIFYQLGLNLAGRGQRLALSACFRESRLQVCTSPAVGEKGRPDWVPGLILHAGQLLGQVQEMGHLSKHAPVYLQLGSI